MQILTSSATMQWETARNESFTRREVRQVHTIGDDTHNTRTERHYSENSNRPGQYVNGTMTDGINVSSQGKSQTKRTIYMVNGDSISDSAGDKFPYKKLESDSGETGSLQRKYSNGSMGRKSSSTSVGSTGSGTKISSVTMPIRSSSFSTGRKGSNSETPGKFLLCYKIITECLHPCQGVTDLKFSFLLSGCNIL